MPPLLTAQDLEVTFGSTTLFRGISLYVNEGDRLGLIGPNGSGKSTLLEVLSGRREPSSGAVSLRKGTRLQYVAQESRFDPGRTVRQVVQDAMERAQIPAADRAAIEGSTLGRTGFENFDDEAARLSGGWQKRLAIAEALVQSPDVLMLDEPTNHLDLAGIEWLETLLEGAPFASVVISHDRYFLENVATRMAELSAAYPGGVFQVNGNYSTFLEKKTEFLAVQAKRQEVLENRVRIEMEWLRRGPKARATKSKSRIDQAQEMIGELKDLRARSRTSSVDIDFSATDRKTKRLIHLEDVTYGYPDRLLFDHLNFTVTAGLRAALVGANGAGKTTLLRMIHGEIQPQSGVIERAENLRIVYFDQTRKLDLSLTLRRALAPDSDSVIYNGRVIHVAAWAARFLFTGEQLNQPVSRLSGGERARVLIARLMLEPADVLLLDEPTNDLDIPTLEILEESLLEFPGAMFLVTHDRYLLDRVSTVVLGLDGKGGFGRFASYAQWEDWVAAQNQPKPKPAAPKVEEKPKPAQKRLSYMEQREHAAMEQRIAEAESLLEEKRAAIQDPEVVRDGRRLETAYREMEEAQRQVDALYERWSELEEKANA